MKRGHYFCRDCKQAWSFEPDKHLVTCAARERLLAGVPWEAETLCKVELVEAPRRRQGARFATRRRDEHNMTPMQRERLLRTLTPAQHLAMLADDLGTLRVGVLRALERRGLARLIGGRNPFWAFTLLGRRLRTAMRELEDRDEDEHRRALEGASEDGAA